MLPFLLFVTLLSWGDCLLHVERTRIPRTVSSSNYAPPNHKNYYHPLRLPTTHLSRLRLKTDTETNTKVVPVVENNVFDGEGTLTPEEDQQLIERLNAEVMELSGVPLDQLINPSKVVNAERDLILLGRQLASTTDSTQRTEIEAKMEKKRKSSIQEKRAIMQGWLKNLFVGQSVVAGLISLALVYQVGNLPHYSTLNDHQPRNSPVSYVEALTHFFLSC